eukprot:s307_g12.t1
MGRSWPACLAACRSDTHLIGSATVIVACSKVPDQGPVRPAFLFQSLAGGSGPRACPACQDGISSARFESWENANLAEKQVRALGSHHVRGEAG